MLRIFFTFLHNRSWQLVIVFFIAILFAMGILTDIINISKLLLLIAVIYFIRCPIIKKISWLIIATIVLLSGGAGDQFFSVSLPGIRFLHILELMFIIIIANYFVDFFHKRRLFHIDRVFFPLILFFVVMFCSIFLGERASTKDAFFAARELTYYAIAIITFYSIKDMGDILYFIKAIYMGSFLLILELLSMYLWHGNPLYRFIPTNVLTGVWSETRLGFRNSEIFLLTSVLSLSFLFAARSKKMRWLNLIVYILSIILVVLSQSRTLLFSTLIGTFLVLILLIIVRHRLNINMFKIIIFSQLVILSGIIGYYSITSYNGHFKLLQDIKLRIVSVYNLERDSSAISRNKMWALEKRRLKEFMWFGQGMKAFYAERHSKESEVHTQTQNLLWENSNTLMIRKVGIIGYSFILLFFLWVFQKLIYCFRHSTDSTIIASSLALLSIVPISIMRTFTSPYLVQYKIIFIYAILFSAILRMAEFVRLENIPTK